MSKLTNLDMDLPQLINAIFGELYTVSEKIKYYLDDVPQELKLESIKLMNRGWFIWFLDGAFPDYSEKVSALVGRSISDQDNYLKKHVINNISIFESELCNKYLLRKKQIEDAFKCHELGLYFSSIPAFLILSEGVGRSYYPDFGIYDKHRPNTPKKGLPKSDVIFDSVSSLGVLEEAVLAPWRTPSDITKSISTPTDEEMMFFNRHLIMHGLSHLYGSQDNSLKAISMLFYVHKSFAYLKALTSST